MGSVEQYLSIYTLGNPAIVQLLAHILQFEEELLVRETQQVAWRLVAIPAGSLQQSAEEVNLLSVWENIDGADDVAVILGRALQLALFHLMIIGHLCYEFIHSGWILIGQGICLSFVGSVMQVGIDVCIAVFWLDSGLLLFASCLLRLSPLRSDCESAGFGL